MFKFNFNFEEKRYEIEIGNRYVFFDRKMRVLPIVKNDKKEKVQTFIPGKEPKYMLDIDGKMKLIEGGYIQEITVDEIIGFNYFRKEFNVKAVSEPKLESEVEKIFNNFLKEAIIKLAEDPNYKFIPKEIPNVEDFVKLYAMAHLK